MEEELFKKEIDEATLLAPSLNDLIDRTVRLMNRYLDPVIHVVWPKSTEVFSERSLSFQNRFHFFLFCTDVLGETEYGGRFYLGILCHAYKLHKQMLVSTDDHLRAAARNVAERIWYTDEADYPPLVLEALKDIPPDLPADFSLDTDDNVLEFLRHAFGSALACAHGFCDAMSDNIKQYQRQSMKRRRRH